MPNLAETIANSPLFKRWQEADLKAKNPEHRGDRVLMTRRPVSQECHILAQSLLETIVLPAIKVQEAGEKKRP